MGKRGGGEAARAGVPGSFLLVWLTMVAWMGAAVDGRGQSPTAFRAAGEELISNGDIEEEGLSGWVLWAPGGGDGCVEQDASGPEAPVGLHSLRLLVREPGQGCGMVYDRLPGIEVQSGRWYDLTFQARTGQRDNNRGYGLTVSLVSREGETVCARSTIPEVRGDWAEYQLALHAHHSHPDCRLIITVCEPGTLWFDKLSLRARVLEPTP